MNKIITVMLVFYILMGSVIGCTSAKIGVVDPIKLFQESTPGKAGMDHLKSIEESMQGQIEVAQGILDKSKDKNVQDRFQKIFMEYQQIINTEQQRVIEVVNTLIQETLDKYRQDQGYSILMSKDNLLSYAPSDDVTNDIIVILNRSNIRFEPIVFDSCFNDEKVKEDKKIPNKQ